MKAAIYSPYLDALGGGERYIMSAAELLLEKGSVTVFWDDQTIKQKIVGRFGLNLSNLTFKQNILKQSLFSKYQALKGYDVFVYLSDGSFPFGFAKNNIMHIQAPLDVVNGKSIINKIKLKTWQHVVCNSKFTKQAIDASFGITSAVIYPPVPIEQFHAAEKKPAIISVGRFFGPTHGKKQERMIGWFKQLFDQGYKDYQLWLVGSIFDERYYQSLTDLAKGYPITLFGDIPFKQLVNLYAEAKIYWHAQGFGETEPRFMEHFGMTTVEAMASGCVPVVIGNGGQTEIVDNRRNGVLWKSEAELLQVTTDLMTNDDLWQAMSKQAIIKSQQFSKEKFRQSFAELI